MAFHAPPRGAWARQSEWAQAFGTSQPLVSAWKKRLQLLERRDTILEYLDRLVAEWGYDKVVIHD